MAKTYRASQTLRCWKQHRCAGCGATFRYLFNRQLTASAPTAEKANANLQALLQRTLAESVDPRPCPHCGSIQTDMVSQQRRSRCRLVFWLVLIALAILLILSLADAFNIPTLTTIATLGGAAAAGALAWTAWRDPNRDLPANRRLAEGAIAKDILRLDAPGTLDLPRRGPALRGLSPLVIGLLAFGFLALPAAEILRALHRWPVNADFYPPVVGPGDQTTLYLPGKIRSVKGYWSGEPRVTVVNADEVGLSDNQLTAVSEHNTWSGTISVKSSEKNSTETPWTKITIHDDDRLSGRVLKLAVELQVTCPQMLDSNSYHTIKDSFHYDGPLALATPGAGADYKHLWYGGLLMGGGLLAATAWLLRRQAKQDARNTQLSVLPLEGGSAPAAPPVPPVPAAASSLPPVPPPPPPPPWAGR